MAAFGAVAGVAMMLAMACLAICKNGYPYDVPHTARQ
jgi:hypothetical protein